MISLYNIMLFHVYNNTRQSHAHENVMVFTDYIISRLNLYLIAGALHR